MRKRNVAVLMAAVVLVFCFDSYTGDRRLALLAVCNNRLKMA